MQEGVSPRVELHLDEESERPSRRPPRPPGGPVPGAPDPPVAPRPPVALVPGSLLIRDEDLAAVARELDSDEFPDLEVSRQDRIGSGWSVIEFTSPPHVSDAEALRVALQGLNADDKLRPDGSPRACGNRIVGCPRLQGGGLPVAPAPANAPAQMPDLDAGPGAGVTVAVLDTVPIHHPDLVGHVEGMPDEFSVLEDVPGVAARGHCLLVAGMVMRVAPAAKVRLVGVLGNDGSGSEEQLAFALSELAQPDAGVDIVNLSLCTPGLRLRAVADAIDALHAQGVGIVAAAGNADPPLALDHAMLPAALPNVVGVASAVGHGANMHIASWSHRGSWVKCMSRGVHRYGPFIHGTNAYGPADAPVRREFRGWCYWDGTSFAAPVVAGAAAAQLSAAREAGDLTMTGAQALAAVVAAPRVQSLPDVAGPLVDPPPAWPAGDPGLMALDGAVAG